MKLEDSRSNEGVSRKRKRKRNKTGGEETNGNVLDKEKEVELVKSRRNKQIKFSDDVDVDVDDVAGAGDGAGDGDGETKAVAEPDSCDTTTDKNVIVAKFQKVYSNSSSFAKNRHHHQKKKPFKIVKYTEESEESDSDANNKFDFQQSNLQLSERAASLLTIRQKLPIFQHKDEIMKFISQNQVTIIVGETGSGKSTQVPQFLIPKNSKTIAVTQPRRVAAASLAARVSDEYGCKLGSEVGYQVRFTNVSNDKTKLKYLTDGMLLREIMLDRDLNRYTTIIIDEAHERTILTDLIMGFLKSLVLSGRRKDLKIVIMSATLDAELFSNFFSDAPILYVEGKMFPVTQMYINSEGVEDVVDCMIRSIIKVNLTEPEGDILCFLAGQEEIDNCVKTLDQIAPQLPREAPLIVALPLYAALSPSHQSRVFANLPKGRRKVILATNIAETSITVPGVKYVIDSGLRKVKLWKHALGLSTLLTTPISQASAKQRAGRAGRESAGKVFRLYKESEYQKLPKQQESEIQRNDIILPVLTLKKMGIDDLLNWTWLENPGQESILSALNTLYTLGALSDVGKITTLGLKMSVLPLPPQLSVVMITAFEMGCISAVIDIVSCLSVDNLILNVTGEARDEMNFKRRSYCPKGNTYGDLIALYELFKNYKSLGKEWCQELMLNYKGFRNVEKIKSQLEEYMLAMIKQDELLSNEDKDKRLTSLRAQLDDDDDDDDDGGGGDREEKLLDVTAILKSFLKGFITNTAVGMPDRSFRTLNTGQLISIHPSSLLFGKPNLDAIMYIEYVFTTKSYARNCSAIELSWIQEVAPHVISGNKISINEE
ncbi:prh1 [Candida oxycetoniae]|uniref:RNA helicase n=1 Tax=Candida oxycetoniae TaxID=497107 RepID=A0AAI9WYL9_9ASCO|nr:prh1 [Candida oxycetoniae]KAI3405183.2 prh1 [Candida oxycetoniae]